LEIAGKDIVSLDPWIISRWMYDQRLTGMLILLMVIEEEVEESQVVDVEEEKEVK
jgi:hypothetical protein